MRIQKYLSRAGVASRRKAEGLVEKGRVRINGVVATVLGTKVDPYRDIIEVDNELISLPVFSWVRFHKPAGIITTLSDTHGRPKIYDLLPEEYSALRYVGRLDMDTEGLLLLTNDGDLANLLQHPSTEVEREYEVKVQNIPTDKIIESLRKGVELEDGLARPSLVSLIGNKDGHGTLKLVLTEGRNREVRRMLEAVGHPVLFLRRIRFGSVNLGNLPIGQWEKMSAEEILKLERYVENLNYS